MKRFFILLSLIFVVSCVKDPSEITTNEVFSVKVDELELSESTIMADNNTRYLFTLSAVNNVDIDDNKSISISTSNGKLFSLESLGSSSGSSSITGSVNGEKFSFYFEGGSKAVESTIMSIKIGNATQVIDFPIMVQEPDELEIYTSTPFPSAGSTIEVTTFLICNAPSIQASENLKINYTTFTANPSDSIQTILSSPNFTYSAINGNLTESKINLVSDSNPGEVFVVCSYTSENSSVLYDTLQVTFN